MPINIQKIAVKGLGPLDEFTGMLGKINLIYGRNEKGKTFLVEFILKSLFRNINPFGLRDLNPSGQVFVSGLETGVSAFSPTSRKKLENFWEENIQGMPTNIAQLLVVKGAELDFIDNTRAGISKKTIKSFLSSEEVLDRIQNKIQVSVQEAVVENGKIIGANRGELKNRDSISAQLKQVEELIENVNQNYSGGRLTSLLAEQKLLAQKLGEQENAKRFLAYELSRSIQNNEEKNRLMQDKGLSKLLEDYDSLIKAMDDLRRTREKQKLAEDDSEHFEWVDSALVQYEKFLNRGGQIPKQTNLFVAATLFIAVSGLALLGFILNQMAINDYEIYIYCGIGVVTLLGLLFGSLFYQQQQKSAQAIAQRVELKKLEKTYKELFNKYLSDIAQLKNHHQLLQEAYHKSKAVAEDVEEYVTKIETIKEQILNGLGKFGIQQKDDARWEETITELKNDYDKREQFIQKLTIDLANLDIEPLQYLRTDPGINFNKETINGLTKELREIQLQIQEEENVLELMKTKIRSAISDQDTAEWEKLLEKLSQKKIELTEEYKDITSKILASSLVSRVISEVRKQEDEKLKASLQMPIVKKPLFDITKRYKEIDLDGPNITVSDGYEEFDVANLSTAAREQVLLALRLGIAAKIMDNDTAFLLLDDAFQH